MSETTPTDGRYYAKDGVVWKAPIKTRHEGGWSFTLGFPVCRMDECVGKDAAETVAELLNRGERFDEMMGRIAELEADLAKASAKIGDLIHAKMHSDLERDAARQDADKLASLIDWIKPYVEMTCDEEGGEESAEAERDLVDIEAALAEHAKLTGGKDFPKEAKDDYFGSLVARAKQAAIKASLKSPQPNYISLKIAEESGEVVRGCVHYAEQRMDWSEVEGEIIQLLAMLIRLVTEGDQINGVLPPAAGGVIEP